MTYSAGGAIQRDDYNTRAWGTATGGTYTLSPANLAVVWGVGTGRYGMGQSTSSFTQVSVGNTVTASQWAGLINNVNNATLHQNNTSFTPSPAVVAGNTITAYATLDSRITQAYNNMGLSNTVNDGIPNNTQFTGTWGTSGNRRLTFTQTVTFASGDAARYFFNAGGLIKLTFNRFGGSATTRNTSWTSLTTECGTVTIGYLNTTKVGGGGSTPSVLLNSNNGGYWNQTYNVLKTHFTQTEDISPYTTNSISVLLSTSGTQGTNGDVGPVLTFTTHWTNAYSNVSQDSVDGTAITALTISSPPTTYITNTWGSPSFSGSVTSN